MKTLSKMVLIFMVLLAMSAISLAETPIESRIMLPGTYIVGVDLPAGSYNIIPDMGGDDNQLWSFTVYLNVNSKKDYTEAVEVFNVARAKATKDGEPEPERVDPSLYMRIENYLDGYHSNRPMRISFLDDQVVVMEYVRYSGKLIIQISKAESIFMD